MIFANPSYLYLLLLLIPLIGWYFWKMRKNQASVEMSSSQAFDVPKAVTAKLHHPPCRRPVFGFLTFPLYRQGSPYRMA